MARVRHKRCNSSVEFAHELSSLAGRPLDLPSMLQHSRSDACALCARRADHTERSRFVSNPHWESEFEATTKALSKEGFAE